jgi:hypothetical protein
MDGFDALSENFQTVQQAGGSELRFTANHLKGKTSEDLCAYRSRRTIRTPDAMKLEMSSTARQALKIPLCMFGLSVFRCAQITKAPPARRTTGEKHGIGTPPSFVSYMLV